MQIETWKVHARATQQKRYKEALEDSEKVEYSKLTLDEIQAKVMNDFDHFYDKDSDRMDVDLMAIILKRNYHIRLGHNKLYRLSKQICFDHPELFNTPSELNSKTAK